MTVSGPAAIAERVAASSARGLGARILLIIIAKRGRVGFRGCHSVFSQVASGLVHVVRGEQDGATFFLESADDVPELAAALGIESGGGLVEKKDAWIAY